jgi:ATP-dependent exoDNAse (exonuclease V) beta subunit
MLKEQQIKHFFKDLTFNEADHKYFVNGKPLNGSVSNKIHHFVPYTDFDAIAPFSARKAGISTEEIKARWAAKNLESRERGHRVHAFGELYQFDRTLQPTCPQEVAITKFWANLPSHIISVAAELRMYHFKKFFAGTMDILLYDTSNNTYIIADYKTNEDLHKNFRGKVLNPPFHNLLDNPLNHYQIQLSYYQILLEQIGVKVSKRVIIWLDKNTSDYTMYFTEDLTPLLN